MKDIQKKALIVLGMHRSGTSLLAGCLHLMGVNLGKSLVPSDKFNEAGYFENQNITLIHDILLRDLGCRWDMIGNLPDGWLDSEASLHAEKKLMSLIERELIGDRPWAVNDPRICRLMPMWLRLLDRMDIQPLFIIMVRHPFEVAKSLEKRDQFDLMKGHLLWMAHYRDALNACLEYPHVISTYDQLLADSLTTLKRIGCVLDDPFPRDIQSQFLSIIDLVRPELKHHQSSHDPEAGAGGVFSQYDWIYQQFRLAQIQAIDYQPMHKTDSSDFEFLDRSPSDVQLSVFPMVASFRTQSDIKFIRNHTTAMFNNLLGIIGRYERADLSDSIRRERALMIAGQSGRALFAQVFFPTSPDSEKPYSEENSLKTLLAADEWEKLSVIISQPDLLKIAKLRIDPLNQMGMAAISSIRILNAATGQVVWLADSSEAFKKCTVMGDAFSLFRQDSLELVCTGSDPQLFLPEIPDLPDCPLLLEVWIKASRNLTALKKIWYDLTQSEFEKTKQIDTLNGDLLRTVSDLYRAGDQLAGLLRQKEQFEKEVQELRGEFELKLHSQELLTREYFSELMNAEKQQSDQQEMIINLNDLAEDRKYEIEILGRQIKETATWKDVQIQKIKNELARIHEQRKQETEKQWREQAYYLNISQLSKWLRQIENDYLYLKKSIRWKTGNILVRFFELMMFRRKQPMVTDHLEQIFQERRSWLPRFGYGKKDQEHLTAFMRQAKNDLDALMHSRRWQFGHGIISIFERLFLRGKPPLAIDHMRSVFDEYVRWVDSINSSSKTI